MHPPTWSKHAHQRLKQRWKLRPEPWLIKRLSHQLATQTEAWYLLPDEPPIEHWVVHHYDKDRGSLWIPVVVNPALSTVVTVNPAEAWLNLSYPTDHVKQPFRDELEHWLQRLWRPIEPW